jgi:bacterioferritin-associated ferredoxin
MIVCICNALTARCVNAAIQAGASTPDEIYELCGTRMRCGTCRPEMCQRLDEASREGSRPPLLADTSLAQAS